MLIVHSGKLCVSRWVWFIRRQRIRGEIYEINKTDKTDEVDNVYGMNGWN
jgi:hypothetical protein